MAKTLDLYEYPNNAAAQAAYVSSKVDAVDQEQTTNNLALELGDVGHIEYERGQTFILSGAKTVTAVELYLVDKTGVPTGDWTIRIETTSGGLPTGTLAHANATVTSAPPAANGTSKKFVFATPFDLSATTTYAICIFVDDQATDTYWRIGCDSTGGYANGQALYLVSGTPPWVAQPARDFWFKIYTENLQCYSEDTTVQQGIYSLRTEAAQTGSLNGTLTRTVTPTIDLSGINDLELYVYASRTGTNIEVKLHNSGGNTITISIAIPTAGVWTKIKKDISAVADVDKDDIDEIKIEIIEAGAVNTFYVDNFYGVEIFAYPVSRLNKNRLTGYHCFLDQYLRAKREGLVPLKLPDGTVW